MTTGDYPEIDLSEVTPAQRALGRLIAIHDGCGDSATWGLYLEDGEGECIADVKWPGDWPNWVNGEFLERQGFRTITA